MTVVTYGSGVTLALEVADALAGTASVEVVDLRTIWPIDAGTVLESVARTSRAVVLQEASQSLGVADTVVSLIAREGFTMLDAPIVVVAAPDAPVPYAPELEDAYLPSADSLTAALEDLLAY